MTGLVLLLEISSIPQNMKVLDSIDHHFSDVLGHLHPPFVRDPLEAASVHSCNTDTGTIVKVPADGTDLDVVEISKATTQSSERRSRTISG